MSAPRPWTTAPLRVTGYDIGGATIVYDGGDNDGCRVASARTPANARLFAHAAEMAEMLARLDQILCNLAVTDDSEPVRAGCRSYVQDIQALLTAIGHPDYQENKYSLGIEVTFVMCTNCGHETRPAGPTCPACGVPYLR